MTVKDRVGRDINEGDFVVYVTAGDRHPVLEFGWVLGFHQSKSQYTGDNGPLKIKIQHSTEDGQRQTKTAVDVAGHWLPHTPSHISTYRNPDGTYYSPTPGEREDYYVQTTYRDTGKPSTTMLEVSEKHNNNRLMVTQPV